MSNDQLPPLQLQVADIPELLHQDNLLFVDVCSEQSYQQGHIPGAVHVKPSELVCGIKPATGKLPELELLNALMQRIGLTEDTHVIVYDDEGSGWAGRFIWTLDMLGHSRYSFIDGGILAWRAAGMEEEQGAADLHASDYRAVIHAAPRATLQQVNAAIGDSEFAFWDARSPEEYRGEKVLTQRGGHIPGARNLNWLELMDHNNNRCLRPIADIQQQLNALGLTRDKKIITHCQTHHRSGLSYLVAKLLGYPHIQGYDGSWSEWGNREDTAINTGETP